MVKPVRGYGALGVRLSDGPAGDGEFGQGYVEEANASTVSIVGSRVACGDVCEFWSGDPPLVLALNRQAIEVDSAGRFRLPRRRDANQSPAAGSASRSGRIRCVTGMPPTHVQLGSGTIVSPCPPKSMAETSSTLTPSSMAMKVRNRAVSSTPAWPITRRGGKPVTCHARWTMASSGLLTTITIASGLVRLISRGHRADDPGVGRQQVVAAHARLARHAGGDHHHVAGRGVVVAGRADDLGVEADDRRGLQVEGLALGHRLGLRDIEEDDVAQLGRRTPMGRGAPRCPPNMLIFARFIADPLSGVTWHTWKSSASYLPQSLMRKKAAVERRHGY